MATKAKKRAQLLERLALARSKKTSNTPKKESLKAPTPEPTSAPPMGIITNPARQVAKQVTDTAMVAGWDQAIQQHAYENRISEHRIREILDEALEYEDKADPSGRIDGIEDWRREKRGNSTLMAHSTA